jgi:hypothetical protein
MPNGYVTPVILPAADWRVLAFLELMTMTITIDEVVLDKEFKALLPAMSDEEQALLREAVNRDAGFTDPIIVWLEQGILIDGYNRYEIWKTELEGDVANAPQIITMSFGSRAEVKVWMTHRQAARRNLNETQRAVMAAQRAKAMTEVAEAAGDPVQICTNQQIAADGMRVSVRSVKTATKVIDEGGKTLVAAMTDGIVRASDAAQILDVPKRDQASAVKDVEAGRATTVTKAVEQKKDDLLEKLANGAPHSVIRPYHESKVIDDLLSQLRKAIEKPVEIVEKLREAIEEKDKACGAFGSHRIFIIEKVDNFIGTFQAEQLLTDFVLLADKWEKSKKAVDAPPATPIQVKTLKRP